MPKQSITLAEKENRMAKSALQGSVDWTLGQLFSSAAFQLWCHTQHSEVSGYATAFPPEETESGSPKRSRVGLHGA